MENVMNCIPLGKAIWKRSELASGALLRRAERIAAHGVRGGGHGREPRRARRRRSSAPAARDSVPAARDSGLRSMDAGRPTSSWGGAVHRQPDGTWGMLAAEMANHCGIDSWTRNSRVVFATSPTPGGRFTH